MEWKSLESRDSQTEILKDYRTRNKGTYKERNESERRDREL